MSVDQYVSSIQVTVSATLIWVVGMGYVFTGAPLFFESDEWLNRQPRFRTRIREDGVVEMDWNPEPGASTAALGFVM